MKRGLTEKFSTIDSSVQRELIEECVQKNVHTPEIIDLLCKEFINEDKGVRDACSSALLHFATHSGNYISNKIAPYIANDSIEIRNLAGDLLIQIGQQAINSLLPYLQDSSTDNQKFACDILGIIGDFTLIPAILPLLDSPDSNVRCAGIEALGNFKSESVLERLTELFEKDQEVQPYIIDALGKIGSISAQHFLIKLLQSNDEFIQISAIDALSLCTDDIAIADKLLSVLPSASAEIQLIILKAIVNISFRLKLEFVLPPELRYIAHHALIDSDNDIRIAGLLALGSTYYQEDIEPLLATEIFWTNFETQKHIISGILISSEATVVRSFFDYLLNICNSQRFNYSRADGSFILELFGFIPQIWALINQNNLDELIDLLFNKFSQCIIENQKAIIEFLLSVVHWAAIEILRNEIESGDFKRVSEAKNLAEFFEIKEIQTLE